MLDMKYLFNTNIFIRSKHEMPTDLWPTFWIRMADLISRGLIASSVKVQEEINRGNDELTDWMRKHATSDFYIDIDAAIMQKYMEVQRWANDMGFTQSAKEEFASVADPYLVSTASAKDMTLVTYETSDPMRRRRVKIPDACMAMGVSFCDLNTVFRELGVTI